jgi:hypothetical protein
MCEGAGVNASGFEGVDQGCLIGITQRHAANHHFVVTGANVFVNDF